MKTSWKAWAAYLGIAISGSASVATSKCEDQSHDNVGPTHAVQLTADAPKQLITIHIATLATLDRVVVTARLMSGRADAVHLSFNGTTPAEQSPSDAGAGGGELTATICENNCGPGSKTFFAYVLADGVATSNPAIVAFSVSAHQGPACFVEPATISYQ